MNTAPLLGLCGSARSGKSSAAALIQKHWFPQAEIRAFADPLKASVAALLGITVADVEALKDLPLPIFQVVRASASGIAFTLPLDAQFTMRQFLQRYGTEAHRNIPQFGEDFWATIGVKDIPAGGLVMPDVRFPSEVRAIRLHGGKIIRVERPGHVDPFTPMTHASEAGIDPQYIGYTLSATNLTELEDAVLRMGSVLGWQVPG